MSDKQIVYRFEVRATMPLSDDPDHPDFCTEAGATHPVFQRDMERALFHLLKKWPYHGDCDVELLDYEVGKE